MAGRRTVVASCIKTLEKLSRSGRMIQAYVKVSGQNNLVYLDTSTQRLLYTPIVYNRQTWDPCSNLSTIFIYKNEEGGITLRSFTTQDAFARVTATAEEGHTIQFLDSPHTPADMFTVKAGEDGYLSLSTVITNSDGEHQDVYLLPDVPSGENKQNARQRKFSLKPISADTRPFVFQFDSLV